VFFLICSWCLVVLCGCLLVVQSYKTFTLKHRAYEPNHRVVHCKTVRYSTEVGPCLSLKKLYYSRVKHQLINHPAKLFIILGTKLNWLLCGLVEFWWDVIGWKSVSTLRVYSINTLTWVHWYGQNVETLLHPITTQQNSGWPQNSLFNSLPNGINYFSLDVAKLFHRQGIKLDEWHKLKLPFWQAY